MPGILNRTTPFSYQCRACGHCCYSKRIQVNPYELLRLARNRRMSTGEFAHCFLEEDGPYLRVRDDSSCVFLGNGFCGVHADRPLACRTYPLGRWVSGDGVEIFRHLHPHQYAEGEYGQDGTVGQFLAEQGALPYLDAADAYQALFYRLFEAVQYALRRDACLSGEARHALYATDNRNTPAFKEWLDVDRTVADFCVGQGLSIPRDTNDTMHLHIQAVDQRLEHSGGRV